MRMRKKKNIEEKIDNLSGIIYTLRSDDLNFNTAVENKEYLDLTDVFPKMKKTNSDTSDTPNSSLAPKIHLEVGCGKPSASAESRAQVSDAPNSSLAPKIHLEVGCGKGTFLCEMAHRHPDEYFIGVEAERNVAYMAGKKIHEEGLDNAVIFYMLGEYLPKFLEPGTVKMVYLNFSCPYPKADYESHRLTSSRFLKIYDDLLVENGEIWMKTDNRKFFEYSIEQLSQYGYRLKNISLDLHSDDYKDNIVTEYEQKFVDLGERIYRLEAEKAKRNG